MVELHPRGVECTRKPRELWEASLESHEEPDWRVCGALHHTVHSPADGTHIEPVRNHLLGWPGILQSTRSFSCCWYTIRDLLKLHESHVQHQGAVFYTHYCLNLGNQRFQPCKTTWLQKKCPVFIRMFQKQKCYT